MKKLYVLLAIFLSAGAMLYSCKKEETNGPNLYDGIGQKDSIENPSNPDPNTIAGLHQMIFAPKCATNGCHDGSFEPDYRTIQSTYYTLVYAPVVKQVSPFQFRVVPYDTGKSWLWRRVTTTDNVLGRMPLYSPALSDEELAHISTWIGNGCPDMQGNKATPVNFEPELYGVAVYQGTQRLDSIRIPDNPAGSMAVPANASLDVWIGVTDDSTGIWLLTGNTLKLSKEVNNFSAATSYTAIFTTTPKIVPDYFGNGVPVPFYYKTTINTTGYQSGDIIYLRYYTKDQHHNAPTEYPRDGTPSYIKTRASLIIQ